MPIAGRAPGAAIDRLRAVSGGPARLAILGVAGGMRARRFTVVVVFAHDRSPFRMIMNG